MYKRQLLSQPPAFVFDEFIAYRVVSNSFIPIVIPALPPLCKSSWLNPRITSVTSSPVVSSIVLSSPTLKVVAAAPDLEISAISAQSDSANVGFFFTANQSRSLHGVTQSPIFVRLFVVS